MSNIYDELRAAVERHYQAEQCTQRWRNDVRYAINALQRFAPNVPDLVALEAACERWNNNAFASEARRVAYSGRVKAAIRLHRGEPTERWPEGAQAGVSLKLPAEMLAAVRALAEERGCTVRDVVRAAIRAELDANPPGRAAQPSATRKKSARNS